MENAFVRRVSCNEKLFIASANSGVNITYRFLIGINGDLPFDLLKAALEKAVSNCKGVNLRYRRCKWYLSDYLPEFKIVESDAEDIYSHPISEIDHRKHTFKASVIHHKKTNGKYISLEFLHCVCDGEAAISFVYDIFAALNGQPLTKYCWNYTDHDVVKNYAKEHTEKPKVFLGCEFKDNSGEEKADRFNLMTTPYQKGGVSAKVSYAVAKLFTEKDVTVMIPVNVRGYLPKSDEFCFGNLTLPLFIQCKGKSRDEISDEIRGKLKRGASLSKYIAKNFYLDIAPMPIVDFVIKSYIGFIKHRKSFILCAIVSYMGDVDESRFENPYFEVSDMIAQAEKYPYCAFDTFSVGFKGHLNVGITCENRLIDEKNYRQLTENIKESFK